MNDHVIRDIHYFVPYIGPGCFVLYDPRRKIAGLTGPGKPILISGVVEQVMRASEIRGLSQYLDWVENVMLRLPLRHLLVLLRPIVLPSPDKAAKVMYYCLSCSMLQVASPITYCAGKRNLLRPKNVTP